MPLYECCVHEETKENKQRRVQSTAETMLNLQQNCNLWLYFVISASWSWKSATETETDTIKYLTKRHKRITEMAYFNIFKASYNWTKQCLHSVTCTSFRFFGTQEISSRFTINPHGELLYGPHAVYAALIGEKRNKYHKLFAIRNSKHDTKHKNRHIIDLCTSMNIPIEYCNKHQLSNLISLHRHNGFVLDCDSIKLDEIETNPIVDSNNKTLSTKKNENDNIDNNNNSNNNAELWIAMNDLSNQDNIGSILRSCLYFGVNGVLFSNYNGGAHVTTPIVARTSSGALDLIDIRLCKKKELSEYFKDWKMIQDQDNENRKNESIAIIIVGLDMYKDDLYKDKRVNVNDIGDKIKQLYDRYDRTSECRKIKVILVVGNEGFGLNENVKEQCHFLCYIDKFASKTTKHQNIEHFDSLHVNAALSITLHKIVSDLTNAGC